MLLKQPICGLYTHRYKDVEKLVAGDACGDHIKTDKMDVSCFVGKILEEN